MAALSGRALPPAVTPEKSTPAPVVAPQVQHAAPRELEHVQHAAPAPAPASVRVQLDSLLSQVIAESPQPRPRPRRTADAPAPVTASPATANPPARRRVPWRGLVIGALSTAALVAVAFAPRLRGLLAAPATRPDGTLAPVDPFSEWASQHGEGYLI